MNKIHLSSMVRLLRPHFPKSFKLRRPKPRWWAEILDPGSTFITKWNQIFLLACLVSLFLDPIYFFLPRIDPDKSACLDIDFKLGIIVTAFRTITDLFHLIHVVLKFRTAYVAKSSRIFGRGKLVMDGRKIALRYLKTDFIVDFAATLPLPQIVIWFVIPAVIKSSEASVHENHTLSLIVLIQYVPRFIMIFPLNRQIIKSTGVVAKTAWSGAAYNLLLYMLAGHVLGASWYLLSIERQYNCWKDECENEMNVTEFPSPCNIFFLDCASSGSSLKDKRAQWLSNTLLLDNCEPRENDTNFKYGMFSDAFTKDVASAKFSEKYFYCLWWGLKNLSAYGQDLATSTLRSETLFSMAICVGGLVLFSHLIGQMQNYLQSSSIRLEEWRVRRKDTEEWMRHRQLPEDLQERVRRFVQYKWRATRGVNEESILRALPLDIRREIQRHLCLALVRRVPFFVQMDDQLVDAICERLVSSLSTKDTYIVREGDPVNEMLFIIRGHLESSTTNGGRSGYFNSITLKSGDFCGEELLTWALMPNLSLNLPLSTRTVRSLTEVEAFALRADDLKFVANQFRRLHSKKLQHAFRYYSSQWRTWGACYIQAAWKRFKRRKLAEELAKQESYYYSTQSQDQDSYYNDEYLNANYEESDGERSSMNNESNSQHLGATILASKFAANTRKGVNQKVKVVEPAATSIKKLFKPDEPDFSLDQEDT